MSQERAPGEADAKEQLSEDASAEASPDAGTEGESRDGAETAATSPADAPATATGSASAAPAADDDDDDEDAEEPEAPAAATPTARRATSNNKKRERKVLRRPPPALHEHEVDSPRAQTLIMMGAVVVPSIAIWLFAALICNIQGVDPTRPKEATLDELTRTAKDTAIEFHQRLATLDHDAAAQLASGSAVAEVEASRKRCQAEGDECMRRRNSLLAHVRTTAVLTKGDDKAAEATVTLHPAPEVQLAQRVVQVKLEKTDRWRVVSSAAR